MNQKILKCETKRASSQRPMSLTKVKLWFHYMGVEGVPTLKVRFKIRNGEQIKVYPDPDASPYICGRFRVGKKGSNGKIHFDLSDNTDEKSKKYYRMVLCRDSKQQLFFLAVDTQLDTWESAVAADPQRHSLMWVTKHLKEGDEVFKLVHASRNGGELPWPDTAGVRALLQAAIGIKIL